MKEKVLIVDDSEDMRVLLERMLVRAGYETALASNGQEALLIAGSFKPDLILLDIVMPDIDGFAVYEELKRKAATDAPVIFLSARTQTADKVRGLETGAADYVTKPFDKSEVLARVGNQLKIRRLTSQLRESNAALMEKQRVLDEDLKAAAGIQQSLLPRTIPTIENLAIAWKFMPSYMIGGDIFNIFRLDEHHLAMYMVDVSGHGVPSALVTVSVSQILQPEGGYVTKQRIYEPPGYRLVPPKTVMETLDREYPIERFNKYFTMVYFIVNTSKGSLTYSNAAHPRPVIIRRNGAIETLDKGGSIIGLGGRVPFEEEEMSLGNKDRLVFYTDGILEHRSPAGEFFGEERLHRVLADSRHFGLENVLTAVVDSVNAFGEGRDFEDDVTIVACEYADKTGTGTQKAVGHRADNDRENKGG